MGTILEIYRELLAAGILDYCKEWKNPAVLSYLQTGESEALSKIPSMAKANWPIHRLIVALDPSTSMDATGRRFLRILVSAGNKRYLSEWMIRRWCCLMRRRLRLCLGSCRLCRWRRECSVILTM
jgi:hypothetical protein